ARREAEHVRDLVTRVTEVVVKNEDGALLRRERPESSLEFVANCDQNLCVVGGWPRVEIGDQPKTRLPARGVPNLGVARVDQQPVQPRFQAIVIAQVAQLPPRVQERLLDRVLRSTRVT